MQVLEGASDDVYAVYDSIRKDPRNTAVVKLVDERIDQRDFPGWGMGFERLEDSAPEDLPGFIDIFNGKLDRDIVLENKSVAVNILLSFARNS